MKKTLALIALCPFALTACFESTSSENVKPAAVYQNYGLTYSEESGVLEATAEFNVGGAWGTTLDLRSPSGIRFDGYDMDKSTFAGTRYSGKRITAFTPNHTWEWTDQDGKLYVNSISLNPVYVASAPSLLSRNGTYVLRVTGGAFASEDRFTIDLEQSVSGKVLMSFNARFAGSDGLLIEPKTHASFKELRRGSARLKLSRERVIRLQQQTEQGGSIRGRYIGKTMAVEVVD